MPTGTFRSFAKINLHLQVVARRPDGYHELRTVFQTVDLHDRIELELGGDGVELEVVGGGAPSGAANLVHRAATAYCERWTPARGVRIRLSKTIPAGGGLGGGSGDAATVLLGLRSLLGIPQDRHALWPVARELGADVPYFLVGGTALGVGRGDEIVLLPDLPGESVVVAAPRIAISTREVFSRLGPVAGDPLSSEILGFAAGRPVARPSALPAWNDLQEPVLRWYPAVAEVYNALLVAGARVVRLSGTGAALFAFFDEPPLESALSRRLPAGTLAFVTRTLTRQEAAGRRVVR